MRTIQPLKRHVNALSTSNLPIFQAEAATTQTRRDSTCKMPHVSARQGGGIEPLHVPMPHGLKPCPGTSLTHPGSLAGARLWTLVYPCYPHFFKFFRSETEDSLSEWLRRWTRNPLGSARRGSNPLAVACSLQSSLHLEINAFRQTQTAQN